MSGKLVGVFEIENGKDMATLTIEGEEVKVERGQSECQLSDGRVFELKWGDYNAFPPEHTFKGWG